MNTAIFSAVIGCVLSACLVMSSPVYPTLRNYSPVDACLFMCNICYDQRISEMMDCANNVCLAKNGYEMVAGLIKLGRVCKNYQTAQPFDFEDNNTQ